MIARARVVSSGALIFCMGRNGAVMRDSEVAL